MTSNASEWQIGYSVVNFLSYCISIIFHINNGNKETVELKTNVTQSNIVLRSDLKNSILMKCYYQINILPP